MNTLRIGLMLLRGGGRRGLARLTLVVVGTAIGAWALLLSLALPQVLEARQQRAEDRTPRGGAVANSDVRFQVAIKRIGDRALPVTYLAGDLSASLPPGLDELPGPGDAVVSPGLARSLASMPDLKAVFPFDVVGTIGQAGLVSPEEWYSYVGVNREELVSGSSRLAGFGSDLNPEVDISAGDVRFVNFALLGLVGLPLLVYFAVSASLSAASRSRRLAALRLLGMSARQARRVNAIETSVAAWLGSALGLVAYSASYRMLSSARLGGMVWFPSDGAPGPGMVLVTLLFVPALGAFVSVVGSGKAVRDAFTTRRATPVRKPRVWRLLPLIAGLGILVGLIFSAKAATGGGAENGGMFLLAGLLLTAVGLTWGLQVVIVSAARWFAARNGSISALLGVRRLEFDPGAAVRVISGLVLVIVGLGFANGLQRDAQASSLPVGPIQLYELKGEVVSAGQLEELGNLETVRSVAVRAIADPLPSGEGQERSIYARLTWTTCDSLRFQTGTAMPDCLEGTSFRVKPEKGSTGLPLPPVGATLTITAPRTEVLELGRVPRRIVKLPRQALLAMGSVQVVLPLERLESVPATSQVILGSNNDPETLRQTTIDIARVSPQATVDFPNANFDARRRSTTTQRILGHAVSLGLLVGLGAFIVATLDRIVERRQSLAALAIVGTSRQLQRRAEAFFVGIPATLGVMTAVFAGQVTEQATVLTGGYDGSWPLTSLWRSLVVGLILIVVSTLAAMAAVPRRIDPGLIRRE